jgi:phospholipid transport system transporter-binding protein
VSEAVPQSCWQPTTALTFDTAAAMREDARRVLTDGALRIDLSGVPEADSAALALLLDVCREAAVRHQAIDIVSMPAGLRSLADLYGVTELLPTGDSTAA